MIALQQTLSTNSNIINIINKNYQHKFDKKLKETFFSTYKFYNHDKNKFIFLLQKGVYLYEYIDDWEQFN